MAGANANQDWPTGKVVTLEHRSRVLKNNPT